MKLSTSVLMALAPLALAKRAHNVYQPKARSVSDLEVRDGHQGGKGGNGGDSISITQTQVLVLWFNSGSNAETSVINKQAVVTTTVTVSAGAPPSVIPAADGSVTTVNPGDSVVMAPPGQTHTVKVGGPAGLRYSPDQLQANINDVVIFEFQSQNHTVTQSTFGDPCVAMPGGMNSGFVPNKDNSVVPPPQIAMQVMTKDPIWMYCGQANHCGQGMVFSLNPTADKTHAQFQSTAIQKNGKGGGNAITDNPNPPPPPPAEKPASVAPPSNTTPVSEGMAVGTGTILPDGSCKCVAVCSPGSFPDSKAQGVGAFGGVPGAIPSNMVLMAA